MMLFNCKFRLVLFLYLLLLPTSVCADWINLSGAENARNIAEIAIEKDRVRIQLEVFVDDLMVFVRAGIDCRVYAYYRGVKFTVTKRIDLHGYCLVLFN